MKPEIAPPSTSNRLKNTLLELRFYSPSQVKGTSVQVLGAEGRHTLTKAPAILFALLITLLAPSLAQSAPAKGIIVYKSSGREPANLAKAAEYSKIERFQLVTHYYPAKGGAKVRLTSDRVAEVIGYPDFTTGTYASEQQIAALRAQSEALKALSVKYPRAAPLLEALTQEINISLQLFDQGKVLIAGKWTDKTQMAKAGAAAKAEAAKATLTVKTPSGITRTYTGVKVTAQVPDALRIMHSAGSATIPYEYLSEADQQKYGFDPVKAEVFRQKQMAVASKTPAPLPPAAVTSESLNDLIKKYKKQYPDKDHFTISRMAKDEVKRRRKEIKEHSKAATTARMAAKYPSYTELIKNIPLGVRAKKSDIDSGNRVRTLLADNLASSAKQSILKRGEIYLVCDLWGMFSIGQRTGSRIVAYSNQVPSFALVELPEPELLDGVKFDKFFTQCVGIYKGDESVTMISGASKTFPVFEAQLLVGPSLTGNELITIRFSDLKSMDSE